MHAPDKTVTVTGQCCPLPLIELAKAMKEMQSGQVLQITGDDPIFEMGVRDYCKANGFTIIEIKMDSRRQRTLLIMC